MCQIYDALHEIFQNEIAYCGKGKKSHDEIRI